MHQNILAYLNTLVLAPLLTAPSISINNLSVTEGNSGTSSADFTVSLSSSYCKNVTVNYTTADSSAVAGSDYLMAAQHATNLQRRRDKQSRKRAD